MKNTNAAIETAASEYIYIATKIKTEAWEERTETNITTFECTDMAAITGMFAGNTKGLYVVTNPATGEKRTYGGKELCEWLAMQTLDTMVDYHIRLTEVWDRACLHGRGKITHEVYFTRANADKKHTADGANTVEDVPQDF